jgi:hypothetical protein
LRDITKLDRAALGFEMQVLLTEKKEGLDEALLALANVLLDAS